MDARTSSMIKKYLACKKDLHLKTRYFQIFEHRYGLSDGKNHTQKETGVVFGISGNRIGQIEARVKYELSKVEN